MSPLLRKNGAFRLYPNRPEYLFLAVFAFSEAFCYAKTAFSCSRALLSPCTPDLFMVKDVVKSECRMIGMWSLLFDSKHAKNYADMWSALQEEMITMWSEQPGSK